jgi:hypothetical protein
LKVLPIRSKMSGVVKLSAVEQRSLRIETVGGFLVTTLLILSVAVPSAAQQTIKILPPINDSCAEFMGGMETGDPTKLAVLASWALGFVSGIALGTGVDVLRRMTGPDVVSRLYSDCQKQPGRALSVTVEEMARSLITEQH